MRRLLSRQNLIIATLLTVMLSVTACTNTPSDSQLQAWHQEAIARNTEQRRNRAHQTEQKSWRLSVEGQILSPTLALLNWQQLQELATTHVPTQDLAYVDAPNTIFDFKGIAISQLLDRVGIATNPNTTEVTFVAFDGFRATISVTDLQRYPIILALTRNGKLLSRQQGGPLYLVFPHAQYPELRTKYKLDFWVFYVTHVIVGTEPIQLKVGNRLFDAASLEKLPQTPLATVVGYKLGWTSGTVLLKGMLLRDVLAAANMQLSTTGTVTIRGKAPIHRDPANPIRLNAAAVNNCNILLATAWGKDNQPIPARMGGPITLAFPPDCPALIGEKRWVTFVEELEVMP